MTAPREPWPATLDAIVRAHVAAMEAEPVRTEPPVEVEPEAEWAPGELTEAWGK